MMSAQTAHCPVILLNTMDNVKNNQIAPAYTRFRQLAQWIGALATPPHQQQGQGNGDGSDDE